MPLRTNSNFARSAVFLEGEPPRSHLRRWEPGGLKHDCATLQLYQYVLADSVAPRIKTLAADWQVWEFAEGATHIEYDGEYGSERTRVARVRPGRERQERCRDILYGMSRSKVVLDIHSHEDDRQAHISRSRFPRFSFAGR